MQLAEVATSLIGGGNRPREEELNTIIIKNIMIALRFIWTCLITLNVEINYCVL